MTILDAIKTVQGRKLFTIFKPLINIIYIISNVIPRFVFIALWPLLDNLPKYLGIGSRYVFAKRLAKKIGDNVFIGRSVEIKNWQRLEVGSNVSIHKDCYLDALGGLVIGNDVSIAHASSILTFDHTWEDSSLPIRSNSCVLKKVIISNDVWIGCGCRILSGVTIESRVVMAAGSVVSRDVSNGVLVAGVPAKVIKSI